MTKAQEIREWALANYADNFGASELVECFTDQELEEEFKDLQDAIDYANLRDDAYNEAQGHIF